MKYRLFARLVLTFTFAAVAASLLHRPEATGRGGANFGATWTAPKAVAPGELVEYPDVSVDGQGRAWVTWIGLRNGHEQVFIRSYDGQIPSQPKALSQPRGFAYWPRTIASGDRVWVVWSAREERPDAPWRLVVKELKKGRPTQLRDLSEPSEDALRPALGFDSYGVPWVAWEARVGKKFIIKARALVGRGGARTGVFEVASESELSLRPCITPAPEGGLYVMWDQYDYGEYQVMARRLDGVASPPIRISDEPAVNVAPSATTDIDNGRVFIAYSTNSDGLGGQHLGKELRVRALVDGVLHDLEGGHPQVIGTAPGRLDTIEFPTINLDREGRLWIFARRGQGWIVFRHEGSLWYPPLDLSLLGWGGRGRSMHLARGQQTFHLVARRLHMLSHQLFTPTPGPVRQVSLLPADVAVSKKKKEAPIRTGKLDDETHAHINAPTEGEQGGESPQGTEDLLAHGTSEQLVAQGDPEPSSLLAPLLELPKPMHKDPRRYAPAEGSGLYGTLLDEIEAGPFEGTSSKMTADAAVIPAEPDAFDWNKKQTRARRVTQKRDALHKKRSLAGTDRLRHQNRWKRSHGTADHPLLVSDGVGAPRPSLASAFYPGSNNPEGGPLPRDRTDEILYGDLHTHSWMSDGAGDPDEVYTRSRDVYEYDFVALTDHDVENGNILLPSEWAYLKLLADFFNVSGQFATFQAYEWTSPAYPRGAGHRNVYFPGDDSPLFNAGSDAPTTMTLFDLIRDLGAIAIPHHIGWTGTDWQNHDPKIQRAVEIVSVHGAFEKARNRPVLPRAELAGMFIRDGLRRGLKFGLVGGSDGHGFPWHYGVSRKEDVWRTGLTGVPILSLERRAILEAIRDRLTFATSGAAIAMWFYADGAPMGSEVDVGESPEFEMRVEGTAPLQEVALIRDGEDYLTFETDSPDFEFFITDTPSPGDHFYYLRAIQVNGEVAWSSPIWVKLKPRIIVGPPDP